MSQVVTIEELIESGVHLGHQVSRWNPKMAPYIHSRRDMIHIIDLRATLRGLLRARHFLYRLASQDEQVLYVGTKRQIKSVVESEAKRVEMPYVSERWIGGTLTNYKTIRSRLKYLEELEAMEKNGVVDNLTKKEQAKFRRELRKVRRNLEGIRNMDTLPGALLVVDPKKEDIAVQEANILSIPVIAILDTDCDPDCVDIPIPANDDAMRSVQLLLSKLTDVIKSGKAQVDEQARLQRRKRLEEMEQTEMEFFSGPRPMRPMARHFRQEKREPEPAVKEESPENNPDEQPGPEPAGNKEVAQEENQGSE